MNTNCEDAIKEAIEKERERIRIAVKKKGHIQAWLWGELSIVVDDVIKIVNDEI